MEVVLAELGYRNPQRQSSPHYNHRVRVQVAVEGSKPAREQSWLRFTVISNAT
jgi:hypothetical protein